jgi:hypothetical protein
VSDQAWESRWPGREAHEADAAAGSEDPAGLLEEGLDISIREKVQNVGADDPVSTVFGEREVHGAGLELVDRGALAEAR